MKWVILYIIISLISFFVFDFFLGDYKGNDIESFIFMSLIWPVCLFFALSCVVYHGLHMLCNKVRDLTDREKRGLT